MPEPLTYLQAIVASVVVAALAAAALGLRRSSDGAAASRVCLSASRACLAGIAAGVVAGYFVLRLRPAWPPAGALDRFLTIVLPAAFVIEWLAGRPRVSQRAAWLLRLVLAAALGRILLHGSVYLSGAKDQWSPGQAAAALAACGGITAALWIFLARLSQRSPGVSLPSALAMTLQCAGLAVMLAGYLKGGAAAMPLAAALAGATLATRGPAKPAALQAALGIGTVGLCGIVCIGHFFGRLSLAAAAVMLTAPLLCWTTELPPLRRQKPWLVGTVRLLLTAIPLAAVLTLAKLDFDRHTAPLLLMR